MFGLERLVDRQSITEEKPLTGGGRGAGGVNQRPSLSMVGLQLISVDFGSASRLLADSSEIPSTTKRFKLGPLGLSSDSPLHP